MDQKCKYTSYYSRNSEVTFGVNGPKVVFQFSANGVSIYRVYLNRRYLLYTAQIENNNLVDPVYFGGQHSTNDKLIALEITPRKFFIRQSSQSTMLFCALKTKNNSVLQELIKDYAIKETTKVNEETSDDEASVGSSDESFKN